MDLVEQRREQLGLEQRHVHVDPERLRRKRLLCLAPEGAVGRGGIAAGEAGHAHSVARSCKPPPGIARMRC